MTVTIHGVTRIKSRYERNKSLVLIIEHSEDEGSEEEIIDLIGKEVELEEYFKALHEAINSINVAEEL